MKINFPKIAIVAFVLNSLIITITGITGRWEYINFSEPQWMKGIFTIFFNELIFSPFGFHRSDSVMIATSVLLLVLAILSLKYGENIINEFKGGFFIVLVIFEILKLLLLIVYSGGGSVVPF